MITKNSFITFFLVLLLVSLVPLGSINAESNSAKEELSTKKVMIDNVQVNVFDDGRIEGIKKPENLSMKQRKNILNLMNFTDDEIKQMPDDLQFEFISKGGVKVDTKIEDYVHIYTDLDGNDHIVTEENKKEIAQLRKNDLEKVATKLGLKAYPTDYSDEEVVDDIFWGYGYVILDGKTSNGVSYKYRYYTRFDWEERPWFYFVDSIAQTWQYHTATYDRPDGLYKVKVYSKSGKTIDTIDVGLHDFDQSMVEGSRAKIDIERHDGRHYGYLRNYVTVPVKHKGELGQFASAYAHSHGFESITITYRFLGFTFSGFGDKWSWKTRYEIGTD
ncbi:hypothetical protein ACQKK5_09670 [Brevibacillus panacihumi]|uniref:hypothetical protein n=1 Tax=Brevibacillus panacihumi TaxID=497735 RepID=UPI003CFD5B39